MNTGKFCQSCGKCLTAQVPGGLCPACMLKVAMETGSQSGETGAGRHSFIPPTVEELAGRFSGLEILEFIGRGGMGAVYKARQKELDRVVALKILPPDVGRDPAFAERFAREAKALAKLNYPGIVTIYDFGRSDGLFFFLMEFVDGVTLRQLLQKERIASREALAIVPQICDALQYAHDQGIVHRDIKPDNILLDRRGRVKVADFGLAKLVGDVADLPAGTAAAGSPVLTDAGKVMGTPNYMAPEQFSRPSEVDHRADIYSLGVVFYQMLTGTLPDKPLEPPSKRVQVDVRLDEVVLRALEQKPEQRYQHASALKTQIEDLSGEAVDQRAKTQPLEQPGVVKQASAAKAGAGRMLLAVLATLLIAGILLVGGAAAYFAFENRHARTLEQLTDRPDLLRKASTDEIVQACLAKPENSWGWSELRSRAQSGRLTRAHVDVLLDGLTRWITQHPNGYDKPLSWLSILFDALTKTDLVSEERALPFIKAFHGTPSIDPLPRVREGQQDTFALTCWCRNVWKRKMLGTVLLSELQSVTIEAVPAADYDARVLDNSWMSDYETATLSVGNLKPGNYVVRCELEQALFKESEIEGLPPNAPASDWPTIRPLTDNNSRRWKSTAEAQLSVVAADQQVVQLVTNPGQDPTGNGWMPVEKIFIRAKGEGSVAVLIMNTGSPVTLPVSSKVRLKIGTDTYRAGNFFLINDGSSSTSSPAELTVDIRPSAPSLTEAEVVLEPDPAIVEHLSKVDRIWGKPIILSKVPVIRQDLGAALSK